MLIEKLMSPGATEEFGTELEIRVGEVVGVEYVRAPGGLVTGLVLPDQFSIPVAMITKEGRRRTELKKTKLEPAPSVDWNRYRVTFVSLQPDSRGYKIKIKAEMIPIKKISVGDLSHSMVSGDEVQGPEGMIIRHKGYVNAHTMSSNGRAGSASHGLIDIEFGTEKGHFSIPVPLKSTLSLNWKNWIFLFTKVDPNGGSMSNEEPIEFKLMAK